jgi:DNA-directed RNA polymerase specialized sigma24 family protein
VKGIGGFRARIVVANMTPTGTGLPDGRSNVVSGSFEVFAVSELPRLRQALVARYGIDVGVDSFAAAAAWAWENWSRLDEIDHKVAYLYRVAQSSQRSMRTWQKRTVLRFPVESGAPDSTSSVDLGMVIGALPDNQRICVLLVHAHRWTYAEVAALLNVSVEAVTNHVHRGTSRLRKLLKEEA